MNLRNFAAITTSIIKLGYSGLIFFLICPDHCEVCSCSKHPEQRDEFSFYLLKIKYSLQTLLGFFFFFFAGKIPFYILRVTPKKPLQMNTRGHSLPTTIFFPFSLPFTPPRCATAEPLVDQFCYRTRSVEKVLKAKVCFTVDRKE